ncbi:MAG: 2Fe-2S iron-sulfur cluster-binding protein [Dehalococcoidia bacterium]
MTLTIDGRTAEGAGSVLDAVLALDIQLPHLCKDDNLPAIGACRTCLVEADGRIVAACSVPASSVTTVTTTSDRAVRIRRGVLELTAGMHIDPVSANGGPQRHHTREVLARAEVDTERYPTRTEAHVDESNPFFAFHEESCILCGRCVTACQQLQHISAIGLAGHGGGTRVTPGPDVSFLESVCTSCGSCVAACPTAALRPKRGGHR